MEILVIGSIASALFVTVASPWVMNWAVRRPANGERKTLQSLDIKIERIYSKLSQHVQ